MHWKNKWSKPINLIVSFKDNDKDYVKNKVIKSSFIKITSTNAENFNFCKIFAGGLKI